MRDLREVGQKVIDSIMKMKPTDAGDLAIGVEDIISDLRSNPAQFQEKLDHLEGLFKELAYGEEYALREKVEDKEEEDDVLGSLFGGYNGVFASGVIPAISGAITPGSLNSVVAPANTGISVKLPVSKQVTAGYHTPPANPKATPVLESTWDDRHGEISLTKEQLEALETYENEEPKGKWWHKFLGK